MALQVCDITGHDTASPKFDVSTYNNLSDCVLENLLFDFL